MSAVENFERSIRKAVEPAVDKQWRASGEAMEQFWKMQDHALDAMEEFTHNWFRRRHAGARQAIRVVRDVAECRDPMEAATCLQEWLQESVRRVSEDVREAQESFQKLMGEAAAPIAPKQKAPKH